MYNRDTIAAISTPVGEGGIGIIRISGVKAAEIGQRIFRSKRSGGLISHRFCYGFIIDPSSGNKLDEVMAVIMKAPNSFTREDVLEIHCHGGYLIIRKILALVLECGARLADPGEFSKRAFLNGRIDLLQAEAVIDLIRSKTDASLNIALRQSEGFLSQRLGRVKDGILDVLALLEAYIDFPDEDIDDSLIGGMSDRVNSILRHVDELIEGFSEGHVIREGVSVVIAGKPNVGKSSLLNTLLQERRAIVTSIPGTTRDVIEEVVSIKGLAVRLLDTAGIRAATDRVEEEGVLLAIDRMRRADLVLFVVDCSQPFDDEDRLLLEDVMKRKYLLVFNKIDLALPVAITGVGPDTMVSVSTYTGEGIEQLKERIHELFLHGHCNDNREYVAITQVRQRDALIRVRDGLVRFMTAFSSSKSLDLLAADLRFALHALGEVTGETTPEDVLDRIFDNFCIGK